VTKKLARWLHDHGYIDESDYEEAAERGTAPPDPARTRQRAARLEWLFRPDPGPAAGGNHRKTHPASQTLMTHTSVPALGSSGISAGTGGSSDVSMSKTAKGAVAKAGSTTKAWRSAAPDRLSLSSTSRCSGSERKAVIHAANSSPVSEGKPPVRSAGSSTWT
jgi:hypothetical protein